MLALIPVFILLGAAVAVTVLQYVPRGTGFAWMVSVAASIAAWIVFIAGKNSLPYMYSTKALSDIAIDIALPAFQIDLIIWPMVVSILAVVCGTIISSATRIGQDADSREWASVLILGVFGIAACISQNVITALMFIGLFDLAEILVHLYSREVEKSDYRLFFWRLVALILLFITFTWNGLDGKKQYEWETLQAIPAQIALVACIIRFGISPIIPFPGTLRKRNLGLETAKLLISFIITTSVIVQLPVFAGNLVSKNFLFLYIAISILLSIFNLVKGSVDFFPISCQIFGGSFIVVEYLNGYSASAILFLSAFIPAIFLLIQSFRKGKFALAIGLVGILGFSGLPFTPNNSGLNGLGTGATFYGVIFVILTIPFFYWMIRTALTVTDVDSPATERWAIALAPIGSVVLIASSWIVFFLWQPNAMVLNISIQAIIMTLGGIGLFAAERLHLFDNQSVKVAINSTVSNYSKKLHFKKYYSITGWGAIIEKPFLFITRLFEGDGGILWAILCLVLIITIISSFGMS